MLYNMLYITVETHTVSSWFRPLRPLPERRNMENSSIQEASHKTWRPLLLGWRPLLLGFRIQT